jgi:hypothetical protein
VAEGHKAEEGNFSKLSIAIALKQASSGLELLSNAFLLLLLVFIISSLTHTLFNNGIHHGMLQPRTSLVLAI